MKRPTVHIAPIFPIKMRYSSWWNTEIAEQLEKVLGRTHDVRLLLSHWAPLHKGAEGFSFSGAFNGSSDTEFKRALVEFEHRVVDEILSTDFEPNDTLLVLDCTTPGLIASVLQTIGKPCRTIGFCHGTAYNNYDMFNGRNRKQFDSGNLGVFDLVLVASEYHRRKLITFTNGSVISMGALPNSPYCPHRPFTMDTTFSARPPLSACVVDRNCFQKRRRLVLSSLNDKIVAAGGPPIADIHGKYSTWESYHEALSKFRYVIVTTREETYGYQVFDAYHNGCVPICPDAFAFSEYLDEKILYTAMETMPVEKRSSCCKGVDCLDLSETAATFIFNLLRRIDDSVKHYGVAYDICRPSNLDKIDSWYKSLARHIVDFNKQ